MLCTKLCGNNVGQELPVSWHLRESENQVPCLTRQTLPNKHHGCTQATQVAAHCQILVAHTCGIDPHSETCARSYDFLRTMPEGSRPHRCRRHFGAFFPQQPRFITAAQTGTSREEVVRESGGGKPSRF